MVALSASRQLPRALADRVHHRVDVQVGHRDFTLRLDDRGHAPAPCGLRLLGFLASRDVEQHALDQPWIAVLVVDRPCELQDPSDRPVLVDHAVLVAQRDMGRERMHVLVPGADEVVRVHMLRPAVLVGDPCLGFDPEEVTDLRAHRDAVRPFVHRIQVDDARASARRAPGISPRWRTGPLGASARTAAGVASPCRSIASDAIPLILRSSHRRRLSGDCIGRQRIGT